MPRRSAPLPWLRLRGRSAEPALYLAPQGFRPFGGGEAQPMEALPGWCAAHAGQAVRLVVGAGYTHTLLADAALPLADDTALREHARLQFAHYHGAAATHWPLAPWRWGERRGVVALHGLDLALFDGLRLVAVEPYWAVALRAACRDARPQRRLDDTAYLVVEGASVTVLDCRAGRLENLVRRRLEDSTPSALAAFAVAWRADASPEQLLVVCGHGLAGAEVPLRGCTVVGLPTADSPGAADWLA